MDAGRGAGAWHDADCGRVWKGPGQIAKRRLAAKGREGGDPLHEFFPKQRQFLTGEGAKKRFQDDHSLLHASIQIVVQDFQQATGLLDWFFVAAGKFAGDFEGLPPDFGEGVAQR